MTIVAKYHYTYNSGPGGGSPFGSSVSLTPTTGPSPNDVTIAVVFSTRNSPTQTFTPSSASTTVRTAILNQRAALDALLAALETP